MGARSFDTTSRAIQRHRRCSALAVAALLVAGCGEDSGGGSTPSGTASGTSATSGSGGSASSTTGSGGAGASGGSSSTSTGGTGGGGGGPVASAGCGRANPPSGDLTIDVAGETGEWRVSLPAGYDPNEPHPLGFAFHGFGRTGPQCQAGDCAGFQDVMQDEAVLVYMTSVGGEGWDDFDLNSQYFAAVLDQLLATTCIDESRIFAAGTSSGAHFSNVLGCRFGDKLVAIAPVAGYLPQTEGCVEHVAALVIHGVDDYHVPFSNGEEARDFWRDQNGCSMTTTPPIADVHASVVATPESHGCAAYDGCDPGLPVTWCEHSEGGYDGSTHGWPLFGGQQIWDFVSAL